MSNCPCLPGSFLALLNYTEGLDLSDCPHVLLFLVRLVGKEVCIRKSGPTSAGLHIACNLKTSTFLNFSPLLSAVFPSLEAAFSL